MCIVCERPCWRSGGELDCPATDAEFNDAMDAMDGRGPCPTCHGKGFVAGNPYPCQTCAGSGSTPAGVRRGRT